SASARPLACSQIWKLGSAEDYVRIFGGSGRTGPIASKNYAVVACQSSMQRSPPVHRRGSGACPDTRRSNKPYATTISTPSVFPASSSPPKLNPVEPPWYAPVCPVVGEGWHREVSPYRDRIGAAGHPRHILLAGSGARPRDCLGRCRRWPGGSCAGGGGRGVEWGG